MLKRIVTVLLISAGITASATAANASQAAEQSSGGTIAGSWMATLDNGERLLMSFNSDGITVSSVQGEVSVTRPVLTPSHGVWAHAGGRQFAITNIVVLYDIQTGAYLGFGKLRALLTLDKGGDGMSGNATIDIFGPDGTPLVTFPHTLLLTRIKVESMD